MRGDARLIDACAKSPPDASRAVECALREVLVRAALGAGRRPDWCDSCSHEKRHAGTPRGTKSFGHRLSRHMVACIEAVSRQHPIPHPLGLRPARDCVHRFWSRIDRYHLPGLPPAYRRTPRISSTRCATVHAARDTADVGRVPACARGRLRSLWRRCCFGGCVRCSFTASLICRRKRRLRHRAADDSSVLHDRRELLDGSVEDPAL